LFVGFGTACEDFDSDGDQDFVVANGHVLKYPDPSTLKQFPLLIEYDGRRFSRAAAPPGSYFDRLHEGRGLATADFDADGDVDVAISHIDEPLVLLENQFHEEARHLAVSLIGTQSNRDAVGARLDLELGSSNLHRQIVGGGSYLSHSSRIVRFALPAEQATPGTRFLVVHWPSGVQQRIDASSLEGHVTLVEPLSAGESEPRLVSSKVLR
jgi:hypothetical protein